MPRTILTDEEREARRRVRSAHTFSNAAYQHYDPTVEGFGSVDDWIATADRLASGRGTYRRGTASEPRGRDADLVMLGLDAMPPTIVGLKAAFRRKAFTTHPDHGGDPALFKKVYAAYERLTKWY